jgi:UDP-N-acetylmuramyl pentapeptide synthase
VHGAGRGIAFRRIGAEAVEDVRGWARPGDVVFLKGSRVVGLERVAEGLA